NTTLLGHAIQEAKKVADTVLVVLGAEARTIGNGIGEEAEILINPQWEQGMGTSISKGTEQLMKSDPHLRGILIMVGDQPFLDASHLGELLDGFQRGQAMIVGTSYGDSLGVPALFHASLAGELQRLGPGHGAKGIIEKYSDRALGIAPKGREGDIDTLEDYDRALAMAKNSRPK